ncbi:cell division protein FtsA [Thermophagus xiamenensis]|uniref:Cell division protein FtsA n=2 Tax=Thermophagus xiamenensis TaxID=385682 RepID=A0A1I1YJZ2_9BACT|nr:cell division protein FtsA [Thermophagus xiamenensis]
MLEKQKYMSQELNLISAIDIGSTKVVAVVGRKHPSGLLEVLGIEKVPCTGVKRGAVLNIEETARSIQQAVLALEDRLGIKLSEVYASITGQHIRTMGNRSYRFIKGGSVISTFDVEQLLQDSYRIVLEPDEKILHVIPQDYIVDHESGIKKSPEGYSGQKIEGNFHVVIGRSTTIKNLEKCIERAGLRLNGLILSSLASSDSVLSDEEKEAGVVMVDIGGGTTDLALFHDGILRYTAVIPFGGNVITSDIKEGCAILYKQAEALKTRFGSALGTLAREDALVTIPGIPGWEPKEISFKSLACIIQARMEEIIELIIHHMERSGFYDKLGAGIVLTGGGARLNHLSELTKLKTGLDVRIGNSSRAFSTEEKDALNDPSLVTAIGLMMSAGKYPGSTIVTREQVLFEDMPPEETTGKKKKSSGNKSKKSKKSKKTEFTGDLFEKIQRNFASIFDERDTEM